MNDENRQPIEDALRRYAEQRRRAWGGPLTMPAHVRAQLHREIERQSAAEAVRAGTRAFAGWRWLARPWAWAGAAALAVVGAVVWQQFGASGAKFAVAARAPAETPATLPSNPPPAAGAPAAAPLMEVAGGRLGAPNAAPVADHAEEKGDLFKPVPGAPLPANLVSQTPAAGLTRSVATPEAESKSARYGTTATVSAPAVRTALRSGGATGGTAVVASAPGPGRAPATRRLAAPAPEPRFGATFRGVANVPVLQQRYVQAAATPVTPVLNSFRIEQAGPQIQLVDADGSVYAATLNEAPAAQPKAVVATEAVASAPASTLSAVKAQPPARTISPQAGPPSQRVQTLVLNAIGTNVRLQQPVVFNGNLLVTNLAGEPAIANQQALMTNEAALQFLFSNSRLEGQVILGATNQFPILAVPAGQ